jgi:hypothetical protein
MTFAAAALLLDGNAQSWAFVVLVSLLAGLVLVTGVLGVALKYSVSPAEQRSTRSAQSPGFARRYL